MQIEDTLTRWRRLELFALIVVVLSLPTRLAFADCPVEDWSSEELAIAANGSDGIGGSGLTGGDEDGIGGSGLDQSGFSDEDGIGGSGLFGTITGFGSVCVNGRRVLYDASMVVSIDSASSDVSGLAIGQVVRVDLESREDGFYARNIDVQHEVSGPVTAMSSGRIEVMGQRVIVEHVAAANGAALAMGIGTRIAVSGLRRSDGAIVASRLDAPRGESDDLVRGVASGWSTPNARIGAVPVSMVDGAAVEAPNANRAERRLARGVWNAKSQRLELRLSEPSPTIPRDTRRVDVEGYATRLPDGRLRIGSVSFDLGARDVHVRAGERVRVRGVREQVGAPLRVREVVRVPEREMLSSLERPERPPRTERVERPRGRPRGDDLRPSHAERPPRHGRPEVRPQDLRPDRVKVRPRLPTVAPDRNR